MYLTLPNVSLSLFTVSVRATGEKTATEPLAIRTNVALLPILMRPKRRKGALQVTILGLTWRMTVTFSGSEGINFCAPDAIVLVLLEQSRWTGKGDELKKSRTVISKD